MAGMSLKRSMRRQVRQRFLAAATALQLDKLERWREQREINRGTSIVRVLYFHGTPWEHADRFRRTLSWLHERFEILDFGRFEKRLVAPGSHGGGPALLLTFDDGLASNYEVAAPLLEEIGVRGVFFVVPAFSLLAEQDGRRFCRDRLKGKHVESAMTPWQIADLSARGHTIGNHTFSHRYLTDLDPRDYHREIVESAEAIESWIGGRVNAFAWPFRWNAITAAAYRIAATRHRYCFAPCAGRVIAGSHPSQQPIWRTSVEAHHRTAELRFQCSGLADRVAAGRRRRLVAELLTPPAAFSPAST
jgi:peptidoglycan/xylan/chitin deacetylase (PgdA/CDA1 family)